EDELDLQVFEQRVAAGRHALQHGDADRAAVLLRKAESLWRGRPLADLEFERFARFEIQRLEESRLLAVEDRIEAELALGRHAALCPELEHLVAEHSLRERLRGQLMLALYRSGRQAEALETYRAGRSLLAEELAVEPGPQLQQLQLAVLGQDTALDLPPPAGQRGPAPPPASPAEQAALIQSAGEAPPRGRRRARRTALALAVAAALAALAIAPLVSRAKAHASRNGNLLALISPSGPLRAAV